ncbi:MAG: hypothetical protein IMZ50_16415 [Candidatus Atribacteria bacterium]|nr:hypothetical protein [Candidatus Atribacteria bacterium]
MSKRLDVGGIVSAFLKTHGYDGLCCANCNGCTSANLPGCGEIETHCEPGYAWLMEPDDYECPTPWILVTRTKRRPAGALQRATAADIKEWS